MIFYIQFECDDDVEKDVIDCIKYYAGGIADLREADYYLLFKNTMLISTFFPYPDAETAAREIYDKLFAILKGGKGRFIIIHIPEVQEEMDKVIPNALLSVNAIEWLNKHKVSKDEKEILDILNPKTCFTKIPETEDDDNPPVSEKMAKKIKKSGCKSVYEYLVKHVFTKK